MTSVTLREHLEPLLLDLFDQAGRVAEDGAPAILMDYHEHVAELGRLAKQRKLMGLSYVCMVVESGLIRLVALSRSTTVSDRQTLASWPALVLEELLGPPLDRGLPRWRMLHQLLAHDWVPDITAQHVSLIECRLSEDRERLNVGCFFAPPKESAFADLEWSSTFPAGALEAVQPPVPADMLACELLREQGGQGELINLDIDIGVVGEVLASGQEVPSGEPLLMVCDASAPFVDTQADHLLEADPPEPDIDNPQDVAGTPSHSAGEDDWQAADQAVPGEVTEEELAMLAEALTALRDEMAQAMASPDPLAAMPAALEAQVEQLHNIVNAANLVGLTGFRQVLEVALINTVALQADASAMADEALLLLLQWPDLAVDYLRSPTEQAHPLALINAFMDPAWPLPAEPEAAPAWLADMSAVRVLRARAAQGRPVQALPEHVDLSVPDDIDRKVLDSLLQELPPHALAFSELVQRLARCGALEDAEEARRVAHTLKGAANTVGIKGVANLTHALEDILVAFGREERVPTPAVCGTMLEAADCLEAMSEALLNGSPAPEECLAVHQKVLDWANRIDQDGLPDANEAVLPPAVSSAKVPVAPQPRHPDVAANEPTQTLASAPVHPQDEDAAETYLRVPASLIDSLLKLAGESAVLTSQIQDRVKHLGDHLGALRSGSRQFNQLSADLEQLVDVRGLAMLGGHTGELDALEMDQYNELHMLSRRIVESGADSREFSRAFEREVAGLRDLIAEKERMQLALQRAIQHTRMIEVAGIVPRLQRTVRQAARVLGRCVALKVEGENTLVDTQLLDRILDPLMHLLRNAVDHGIEPPEVREALGKPLEGLITLRFTSEGNNVALRCEDDGAGMDLAAIRQRAVFVGLINADAQLSEAQTMRLILVPGFSTRTQTTQISGRGIGMDVVQQAVLDLRGTLEMSAKPGQGSCFDMHFPVSMSTQQVMLTRSDTHLLGLSVRGVDQILPAGDEVKQSEDGQLTYDMQGELLPAIRLESLLGLPPTALRQSGVIEAAMIIRDAFRQRRAIIVPELLESRIVVVKPFHAGMPHMLGVDGATVLGDGAVACVLDLPDLLRGFHADAQPAPIAQAADTAHSRLPLCLVVDDSVSVRRTMEQLMHDSGYEVVTARDGVDALGVVQSRAPDIVLVDLEMPRMNGLELTSALRNRSATKATPVVMITSRFTDKHRQLASDAGVNAFLTKPYSEDLLLNTMDGLLRSAA